MEGRNNFRRRSEMIEAGLSLDEQNIALLENIAWLKTQIDGAKAFTAETGNYSDADWYNRANHALRMMKVEHQACIQDIGKRNKAERRSNGHSVEGLFMQIARQRLDHELYESIRQDALEMRLAALEPLPQPHADNLEVQPKEK